MDVEIANTDQSSGLDRVFREIYARANSGNADIDKLVAILDATKDSIAQKTENGAGAQSPIAYFGAFMTALERTGADHAKELFYLLSVILPYVPVAVLRSKLGPMSGLLNSAMNSAAIQKNISSLRSVITSVGIVLSAQELTEETWKRPVLTGLLVSLLRFMEDSRPKVRRAAQTSLLNLITTIAPAKLASFSDIISTNLEQSLAKGTQKDQMTSLQLMPIIRQTLPLLPTASILPICERLATIGHLGNSKLTAASFHALTILLESPQSKVSLRFVIDLINGLLKSVPDISNTGSVSSYCYLLAAGITRLATMEKIKSGTPVDVNMNFPKGGVLANGLDSEVKSAESINPVSLKLLPEVMSTLISLLQAPQAQTHYSVANSISIIFVSIVDAGAVLQAREYLRNHNLLGPAVGDFDYEPSVAAPGAPPLVQVACAIEKIADIRVQASWRVSLPLFSVFFRHLGPESASVLLGPVKALLALRAGVSLATDEAKRRLEEDASYDFDSDDSEERGVVRGRSYGRGAQQRRQQRAAHSRRRARGGDSDSDDNHSGFGGGAILHRGEGAQGGKNGLLSFAAGVADVGHASEPPSAVETLRLVHRLMAVLLRSVGPTGFLALLPLSLNVQETNEFRRKFAQTASKDRAPLLPGISPRMLWLLPILRAHLGSVEGETLGIFTNLIFPLAVKEDEYARHLEAVHAVRQSKQHKARSADLWRLLPLLCVAPTDIPMNFNANFGRILTQPLADAGVRARYPELPAIVAKALSNIVGYVKTCLGEPVVAIDGVGSVALRSFAHGQQEDLFAFQNEDDDEADDDDDVDENEDDMDDDEDKDEDNDDDMKSSFSAFSASGSVFGAGGVSVFAGDDDSPLHPLISAAYRLRDAPERLTEEEASAAKSVLAGLAKNYVPTLFSLYETLSGEFYDAQGAGQSDEAAFQSKANVLLSAIVSYLSASPAEVVTNIAGRVFAMLKQVLALSEQADNLLEETSSAGEPKARTDEEKRAIEKLRKNATVAARRASTILALSQALVPAMGALPSSQAPEASKSKKDKKKEEEEPTLISKYYDELFPMLAPIFADSRSQVLQKRAYHVLTTFFQLHPELITEKAQNLQNVLEILLPTAALKKSKLSVASQKMRMACLLSLVRVLPFKKASVRMVIPAIVNEVLFFSRQPSRRARARADALLLLIAEKMLEGGAGEGVGFSVDDVKEPNMKKVSKRIEALRSKNGTTGSDGVNVGAGKRGDNGEDSDEWEAIEVDNQGNTDHVDEDEDEDEEMEGEEDEQETDEDDEGIDEGEVEMDSPESILTAILSSNAAQQQARMRQNNTPTYIPSNTLSELYMMLLAGLQSKIPSTRAAALRALARVTQVHGHDATVQTLIVPPTLCSALLLLSQPAREVAGSVVAFVRVCAGALPPRELLPLLPRVLQGVLVWTQERRNFIKHSIRGLVEKLIRRCGLEPVASLVPPQHSALIRHIRKLEARKTRNKQIARAAQNAESGFEDEDEGADAQSVANTEFEDLFDNRTKMYGGRAGSLAGFNDEDAWDDEDYFAGAGAGSRSKGSQAKSVASSQWAGTRLGSTSTMSLQQQHNQRLLNSRMSAVTSQVRSSSNLLSKAQGMGALPAVGSSVAPSVLGRKYEKMEQKYTAASDSKSQLKAETKSVRFQTNTQSVVSKKEMRREQLTGGVLSLHESAGTPLDLSDARAMSNLVSAGAQGKRNTLSAADILSGKKEPARSEAFKVDARGRLVITDDDAPATTPKNMHLNMIDEKDEDSDDEGFGRSGLDGKRKKARFYSAAEAGKRPDRFRGEDDADTKGKHFQRGEEGLSKRAQDVRARAEQEARRNAGTQYQGKGRGDVKKAGSKYEPFAYIPLNAKAPAVSGESRFASVLKSTSKTVRSSMKRQRERD